ncbi:MAG: hypothetical protein ACHQJ5_01350 [Vicinamibacteria bacterium]|jgi:hypothetical protein
MTTGQAPAPQPPPRPSSNWTGGRIAGIVVSSIAALIGLGLLIAGLALIAVHSFARDDDGFYTSDKEELRSPAYAITTDEIDLGTDVAEDVPDDLLGTLRVRAQSIGGGAIFLGIGRSSDVEGYLGGVARSEFVDFKHGSVVFAQVPGRAPERPPGAEQIWVAQSQGPGEREIDWDVDAGTWTVAILNADASRGIAVEADIGAKVGWLIWLGLGLAVVGLAMAGTGVALIIVIGRRAGGDQVATPT